MAAKARSRTPADRVRIAPGSVLVADMSIMPAIKVMPVQRGSTFARATATPSVTPATTMSAEWTVN
ncbi:MAG: hypothetical protein QOJ08_1478, partial [Ilumatobacteraceae bacterium]